MEVDEDIHVRSDEEMAARHGIEGYREMRQTVEGVAVERGVMGVMGRIAIARRERETERQGDKGDAELRRVEQLEGEQW